MKRALSNTTLMESVDGIKFNRSIKNEIDTLENNLSESINRYEELFDGIRKERSDDSFGVLVPSKIELDALREDRETVLSDLINVHKTLTEGEYVFKDIMSMNVHLYEASDNKDDLKDNMNHATYFLSESLKEDIVNHIHDINENVRLDTESINNIKSTLGTIIKEEVNKEILEENVQILTKEKVLKCFLDNFKK